MPEPTPTHEDEVLNTEVEPLLPAEELTAEEELSLAVARGEMEPPEPTVTTAKDEFDDVPPLEYEAVPAPTEPPEPEDKPRRRGGKRKSGSKRKPKTETVVAQQVSRDADIETWIEQVEAKHSWSRPGVTVTLERLNPIHVEGHTVGGILQQWKSKKPELAQMIDDWGGGDFELRVNMERKNAPPIRLRKKFSVGGAAPRMSEKALPEHLGGIKGAGSTAAPQEHHPAVQKSLVDQLGRQTDRWAELAIKGQGPTAGGGATAEVYDKTFNMAREATEQRATAREAMAHEQVSAAQARVSELEDRLDQERKELDRRTADADRRAAEASKGANDFLGALLPTLTQSNNEQVRALSDSAQKQVADVLRRAEENEKRLHDFYRQQADSAKTLHQMEVKRLETMTEGQLTVLRTEVQTLRGALDQERTENSKLRDDMMKQHILRAEQLQQNSDPVEMLGKFAQVRDVAAEVMPSLMGGMGGEEGGLSDEAPDWMKLLNNLGGSLGPMIGQIMEARSGGGAPAQANPPQRLLTQEEFTQLQQQNPQAAAAYAQQVQQAQAQGLLPPPQAAGPAAPQAGQPEAVGAEEVSFDREELANGVQLLANLMDAGAKPTDAASAARVHLDNGMLRELARRTPSKVLEALEQAGILEGAMATEQGKAYVTAFLNALREAETQRSLG